MLSRRELLGPRRTCHRQATGTIAAIAVDMATTTIATMTAKGSKPLLDLPGLLHHGLLRPSMLATLLGRKVLLELLFQLQREEPHLRRKRSKAKPQEIKPNMAKYVRNMANSCQILAELYMFSL